MHLGLEIFFINKCRFGDLWITVFFIGKYIPGNQENQGVGRT